MADKRMSLIVQEGLLKSVFPGSIIKRDNEQSIVWTHTLTPSPISDSYKVKLKYKKGEGVSFYVIEPKLKLAEGHTYLPHVYSTEEQKLCLYDPNNREWNPSMAYVKTLIPWASEWLQHYEIWVSTGEWHGGGIHPTSEDVELTDVESAKAEVEKNVNNDTD